MKSRISIDVDIDNQPIIKIEYSPSEDVRDKLVKKFLETFGSESSWAQFYYMPELANEKHANSVAVIRPKSIYEMIETRQEINIRVDAHEKFLKSLEDQRTQETT